MSEARVNTESKRLSAALARVSDVVYELPSLFRSDMNVRARVIADAHLLEQIRADRSLEQLVNVSALPGVVDAVVGLPDMHEGYGFPVGGVAATLAPDGVISPGGIGFDINCGVRLLRSELKASDIMPLLSRLLAQLGGAIPSGYGQKGRWSLRDDEVDQVLARGSEYLIRGRGYGSEEDLAHTEANGCLTAARPQCVSARAKERGRDQLGTLGGGNHFLEVQRVDAIYDSAAAQALGLSADQITVLIHTGSRGLGHQVCTDYVREMDAALARHRIVLPDRQLACAPLSSREGSDYFAAMSCAANFAWANRQLLCQRVRDVFANVLGREDARLALVYDVAHNIAKLERHRGRELCVHRKGATRAFGPGHPELPEIYRALGQPVFIPGSMGTASFVLVGSERAADLSFSSACHGAGRAMSRAAAKRSVRGRELRQELAARGIIVHCQSDAELAEEAPLAYKDVERVVDVVTRAGLAKKVARLTPLAVLKG